MGHRDKKKRFARWLEEKQSTRFSKWYYGGYFGYLEPGKVDGNLPEISNEAQ